MQNPKVKRVKAWAVIGYTGKIACNFDSMPSIHLDKDDAEINRWGNQKIVPVTITCQVPKKK